MADLRADILQELTRTRDVIRANMQSQKVNATGRTSASLRVVNGETNLRLIAGNSETHDLQTPYGNVQVWNTAPWASVEIGQKPSAYPKGFYYIIKQWSRDKGIQFNTESERSTFAYFAARKIVREGTERYHVPIDVYSTATAQAVMNIIDICGIWARDFIHNTDKNF